MKMSQRFMLAFFAFLLILGNFPVHATNEGTIDVLYVTKIGSTISIELDYGFNATSELDTSDSLAVITLFSQADDLLSFQASMLFFQTADDQLFHYWMLGDPYKQAQNWQEGTESGHYQISDETLTLNFIEFLGINNPGTEVIVLARITLEFNQTDQMNDFQTILDEFVTYLPTSHEIPTVEPTTTTEMTSEPTITPTEEVTTTTVEEVTTTTKEPPQTTTGGPFLTSGLTILSTISIFLSILITRRTRQKK